MHTHISRSALFALKKLNIAFIIKVVVSFAKTYKYPSEMSLIFYKT